MIYKEKLGSLCYINSGGTPSRSVSEYYGGIIPWAKIGDIENSSGVIYSTKEYITEAGLESIGNRIFPIGTLLFAMYGSVGKVAFCGVELSTNQAILGIRLKEEAKEKLDLNYLKYWFQFNLLFFKSRAVGGILKNLSATIVRDFDIPLPSINDQKRIARILSECEKLIQKRKETIELLDDLLSSTFLEMFGDPIKGDRFPRKTFKEISTVRQGLQIAASQRKSTPGTNRYPYITNQFINGSKIAEYIENPRENVICNTEDVLMTRTGNTGIVLTDVHGVFHNNFFLIDFDRQKIQKKYLLSFLRHPSIKALILKKASTTTIPDLNHGDFYNITIPIPPPETQSKFSLFSTNIDAIKVQYNASLLELENLYGSISQKVFKGELDLTKVDISDMEDSKKKETETVKEDTSEQNLEFLNHKKELLGIVDDKKTENTYLSKNCQLYIDKSKDLKTNIFLLSKKSKINIADFRDDLMVLNKIGEELIAEVNEYTAWQIDQHKPVERYISLLPENILVDYPNINIFSRNQFDYSSMTLDDYYGIPNDIIEQYGSIEDQIVDVEFFFKKYFSNQSFTLRDVELLYNKVVYEQGDWFRYEEMKDFVFKSLEGENAFLTQTFEEIEISDSESANPKTIKRVMLKVLS